MKKIIGVLVIVVIVIILILVSTGGSEESKQGIKIGGVLSLSGQAAPDGESIKKGMELAKSDLAKQGIAIELVYQDDKTEAKDTVSAIQAIATQGVEAIIGPTWSFLGDAGVPVADRLKLVTVMPANTSEYVGARSPYAFFTATKVAKIEAPLTVWLKEHNIKKIAMIGNQGAWYENIEKVLTTSAQNAGAEMVFVERIPFGSEAETLSTIIAKLKTKKFDLIFAEIDDEKGISVILKRFQELGIATPFMSVTTAVGKVLRQAGAVEVKNDFYMIAPKASDEFKNKFKDYYGVNPGPYADSAYDSTMLLVDAIQHRGNTSLADYLHTVTDYTGFAGEYKFDVNGDIIGGEWVVEKLK